MRYFASLLMACLLSAEVVDRLAVTVGATVITELQIDEDLRVAALLNGLPISRDLDSRRSAADRLVEQLLIKHEIELSHYPPPSNQDVQALYSSIQETLGGAGTLKELLSKYQVSDEVLRAHLQAQLATIRFIEIRFTPDISISDAEIEAAYRRQVIAAPGARSVPLDASERSRLTNVLLAERTDAALDSWLAESRKQVNIVYIDSELR